jgi:HEAT repeat protein
MKIFIKITFLLLLLYAPISGIAQQGENEELKIAALEALISAPPERAMPIVQRVLAGDDSDEIKARALFVLSQIDTPEAQTLLLETARNSTGELQSEAIRMIGISGNPAAVAALSTLYAAGDRDTKESVLEAYMIAGDPEPVYQVALNTEDPGEFASAVEMLGAMGALEELRALRQRSGMSDALIDAYAIAGDVESLETLARDGSDPERQAQALEALGIAGGNGTTLAEIYRSTDNTDVKEAALDGMMIGGHDDIVLDLFRSSDDAEEKRAMLELLVMMGSEEVWDIVDQTLEAGQ